MKPVGREVPNVQSTLHSRFCLPITSTGRNDVFFLIFFAHGTSLRLCTESRSMIALGHDPAVDMLLPLGMDSKNISTDTEPLLKPHECPAADILSRSATSVEYVCACHRSITTYLRMLGCSKMAIEGLVGVEEAYDCVESTVFALICQHYPDRVLFHRWADEKNTPSHSTFH